MAEIPGAWRLLALGCLAAAACGCGNPCDAEKEQVGKALDQARAVHADAYAPLEFERAKSAVDAFGQECATQSHRFFLLRSYRRAQSAANDAKSLTAAAVERGKAGEGLMRQEALNTRYEAGMAINDATVALRRALSQPGNQGGDALVGRLKALQASLIDMQRMIEQGNLGGATEKGRKIHEEAIRLVGEANGGTPAPAK